MIYLKARIKGLHTQMSRRRSLHSELKVLMANIMASNIADGFIHQLRSHMHNYTSYVVVWKVSCVVYLSAAGLWHASWIYVYILHSYWGLLSQLVLLQHCRPCDVTCIESDCYSSIYTMFLLGISMLWWI